MQPAPLFKIYHPFNEFCLQSFLGPKVWDITSSEIKGKVSLEAFTCTRKNGHVKNIYIDRANVI